MAEPDAQLLAKHVVSSAVLELYAIRGFSDTQILLELLSDQRRDRTVDPELISQRTRGCGDEHAQAPVQHGLKARFARAQRPLGLEEPRVQGLGGVA